MQFGWEGDGGIGEVLIAQTIAGTKTATCGFKRAYTVEELEEVLAGQGHVIPVIDRTGVARCTIRILEVFETAFGDPDPRLVRGEGDGDDVAKFQADHRIAWAADFGDEPLNDEELLVVELFELVTVVEHSPE
jgi:uncharacterized protein YhfF